MSVENGYPIKGILIGLVEGSMELQEAEEILEGAILKAATKGYFEGVEDAKKLILKKNG